jgi:urease accessory protein
MSISRTLAALFLLTLPLPAAAHHPMGGATPDNFMQGLLSGFGHPIIGPDHLFFVIAVGVAVFYFGQRAVTIGAFLGGTLGGTLLHLGLPSVAYTEAIVAVSLVVLGVLFYLRCAYLRGPSATLLFGLSGIAHGYAYGEAIVGAETAPLLAYLAGLTLVQLAIAVGGFVVARYVAIRKPRIAFLSIAGGVLTVLGAGYLLSAVTA